MSEKLENKNKKKEGLTWGSPLCSPAAAGRPSQQAAQPTWPLLCRLPPRQGNGACRRARTVAPPAPASPGHLLLPPRRLERPGRRHAAPTALSLSPSFSLPCISPSPRTRSAAVAAARRGHSHRLPLASPSCPGAPPRRHLPPRRATQAGVPRGAAIAVIFVVGHPRSSAPVRRLRLVPEPVDHPVASAVSFCACSPFSSSSPCAVDVLPLEAELRPPP